MASAGKWEVVGKGGKKRPFNDKKKDKLKLADAPKLDIASPVPESETIYHAFDIHERKQQNKNIHFDPYAEANNVNEPQDKPQEQRKMIKKKPLPPKPQKTEQQLLEEALEKVELDQLRNILAKDQETFPNNPSLWLKDISSYVHLQLQSVPEKDPAFEDKPKAYPTCLLPKDIAAVVMNALKKSSAMTLDLFFQYCMNEMVLEISRGHSVYGLQIMLQCTVMCNPKIMVTKLDEYEEMLSSRRSRPREALALLWVLGQLPDNNVAQGMTVWTQVMMPLLSYKQLAKFAVNYLEQLLRLPSSQQALLKPQDFFSIMSITFSTTTSPLAGNHSLQRKMLVMYPKLRAMSLNNRIHSCGRAFFVPMLMNLGSEEMTVEHLTEMLDCLTLCLEKDPESYSLWVERYPKALQESSVLLYHIVDTWETRSSKVNKAKLLQTVTTFQVFNSEQEQASKHLPGLQDCIRACKAVEDKTQHSSCFSFKCLLKLLILVLIAFISYDVYKHHGYQGSKTAKFAKEYGVEQGAIHAYGHARRVFDKGNSWVQENYPTYYSKYREYADPAGRYAWEKLTIAGEFIVEQTQPARDYLNKKVPQVLEKIEKEAPVYWGTVRDYVQVWWDKYWPVAHKYIQIVWEFLRDNVPPLVARIQEFVITLGHRIYELAPGFFNSVAAWLERLGQKIVDKSPDVVAVVQEYAVIASNLAMNLINNVVAWLQSLAASGEDDVVVAQQSTTSGPGGKSFPK